MNPCISWRAKGLLSRLPLTTKTETSTITKRYNSFDIISSGTMSEDEMRTLMIRTMVIMMTTTHDDNDGAGGFCVILIKTRFLALELLKTVRRGGGGA